MVTASLCAPEERAIVNLVAIQQRIAELEVPTTLSGHLNVAASAGRKKLQLPNGSETDGMVHAYVAGLQAAHAPAVPTAEQLVSNHSVYTDFHRYLNRLKQKIRRGTAIGDDYTEALLNAAAVGFKSAYKAMVGN
jgi:hypothetical protein